MKKMIVLFAIFGITVNLMACGGARKEETAGGKDKTVSETAVQDNSTKIESKKEGTGTGSLHMVANPGVQEEDRGYIGENGYYYITEESEELKDGLYGKHLMYMDFATRREVYLCSTSGCKHDTEDCTAVLSEQDVPDSALVFCYGDVLYLLSMDTDRSGTMEIISMEEGLEVQQPESHPAVLYRMGMDGSGRTKVYEFDEGLIVESTVMEAGGNLYFIVKKVETRQLGKNKANYSYSSERRIVKLDPSSGDMESVYQFESLDTVDDWTVLGCFDNSLVLGALCYDHALTDEERMETDREKDIELLKKTKDQIAVLDLDDLSLKVVYEHSNKSEKLEDQMYGDGILYISREGSPEIRQIDLRTGKKSTLAKLKNNNIMGIYEDVICCRSWDLTKDYTLYFVNRKNGHVSHCGLVNKSLGWALEIMGEIKDKFLVVYDYDATPGGDDSYEITRYYYALIKKEDLYKGKESYLPIKMAGKGM